MKDSNTRLRWTTLPILFAAGTLPIFGVDGVVLINQAAAMTGVPGMPGDAPGFPVTISLPGSYRLSSNLVLTDPNTTAIEITADDVKLDLNGFAIVGPAICKQVFVASTTLGVSCSPTGSGRGVTNPQNNSNIAVSNGTVRGMGSDGLRLFGGARYHAENVRAISNGGGGIFVVGADFDFSDVMSCTASRNGSVGIEVRGPASGNFVEGNGSDGILSAGVTTNNFVRGNGGAGIRSASVVAQNLATTNQVAGIVINCPANLQANLADGNGDLTINQQIAFPINPGTCVHLNNSPPP